MVMAASTGYGFRSCHLEFEPEEFRKCKKSGFINIMHFLQLEYFLTDTKAIFISWLSPQSPKGNIASVVDVMGLYRQEVLKKRTGRNVFRCTRIRLDLRLIPPVRHKHSRIHNFNLLCQR